MCRRRSTNRISKEITLVLLGSGALGATALLTHDDDSQIVAQAAADKQLGTTTHSRIGYGHFFPVFIGGSSSKTTPFVSQSAAALPRGGFGSVGRAFSAGS